MALVRMGVEATGSLAGDAARRDLPTIYGYDQHVALVNGAGRVLVNDEGEAYTYIRPKEWGQ